MALATCPECGNQVSTKAKACPKCGATRQPETSRSTKLVGTLFAIAVAALVYRSVTAPETTRDPTPPREPVVRLDKSDAAQARRQKVIAELIDAGIFHKVDVPGSLPHVWVTPAFAALPFDQKGDFVAVVYAYYFDGSNLLDHVVLIDSRSGKRIGSYSRAGGGLDLD